MVRLGSAKGSFRNLSDYLHWTVSAPVDDYFYQNEGTSEWQIISIIFGVLIAVLGLVLMFIMAPILVGVI